MRTIELPVEEILECLGNQVLNVQGPINNRVITNLADVVHTRQDTLDWVNPSRENAQEIAEGSKAKVILVGKNVDYSAEIMNADKTLIVVKDPKVALAIIGNKYFVEKSNGEIHPTAIIDKEAVIGEGVTIGPYTVVGKASIGKGSVISSFVRIYDNVTIGEHCFVKEGAVIGGIGFGFERDEDGNRFRFPQIGGVRIGNHVDIGGNTCIDRGALSDTVLEDYAKVDNLCHIAHNVHIGKNAVVVACAEVSGSCVIGDDTWVGPNVCIRDQYKVGSNSLIGMGAVVVKNVGDNEVWAGNPARPFNK